MMLGVDSSISVAERFNGFVDIYGLIHPTPVGGDLEPASNNGLTYTSEAYVLALLTHGVSEQDRGEYFSTLKQCEDGEGLYDRYPGNNIQNSHDDYTLIAVACYFLSLEDPVLAVVKRLRRDLGFVNTDNKLEAKDFLARFVGMVALLKYAAGIRPKLSETAWLAFQIAVQGLRRDGWKIVESSPGDTSGKCLNYFRILASYSESWLCRKAANFWFKRMQAVYPGGVTEIFMTYFGQCPEMVKLVKMLETIRNMMAPSAFADFLRSKRFNPEMET